MGVQDADRQTSMIKETEYEGEEEGEVWGNTELPLQCGGGGGGQKAQF